MSKSKFYESFLSTHTLSLWNSSHLSQPLVKVTTHWHTTSNRCRFDVDIKSIHRKENIDKFPISSSFWLTFPMVISVSEKSALFRRTLFGVTSMSEILTSFRCTFFKLISLDKKSTLFRCIFWRNLVGKLMLRLFWCDFGRQVVLVVLISLFDNIFDMFLIY